MENSFFIINKWTIFYFLIEKKTKNKKNIKHTKKFQNSRVGVATLLLLSLLASTSDISLEWTSMSFMLKIRKRISAPIILANYMTNMC